MVAANHHHVGLVRERNVVGVVPFAAQQHRVFVARNRLSDRKSLDRQPVGGQFLRPLVGGLLQIHGGESRTSLIAVT